MSEQLRGSFRCWPKHWRDAAVEAKLAFRVLDYIQLYDPTMMTHLEVFAKHVQDHCPSKVIDD